MTDFEYLRNDVYHLWIGSPNLSTLETIGALRRFNLIDRPQFGLKEALIEMRKEFDSRPKKKKDYLDNLPKDDSPIGSNPFMEN